MTSAELIARIKKQPIGFVCGLICLLCIGWLYYRSGETEKRQAEYETKSAEANKVSSNVSISKNLPEQVAELQAATKELEARLIKAGQLAVNLQYFYKLEAETEVKVDPRQNSLVKSTKPSLYVGIPYSVSVQGPYKNVMTFLQRVEKGRHFCRVNNATFAKTVIGGDAISSAGTGITLNLTLELLGQP